MCGPRPTNQPKAFSTEMEISQRRHRAWSLQCRSPARLLPAFPAFRPALPCPALSCRFPTSWHPNHMSQFPKISLCAHRDAVGSLLWRTLTNQLPFVFLSLLIWKMGQGRQFRPGCTGDPSQTPASSVDPAARGDGGDQESG